jgi:hypothetical protein
MNPILYFLDWLIRAHGEALTSLFVYVDIPYFAWLLGWRAGRKKTKQSHTFVLMIQPPAPCHSCRDRNGFVAAVCARFTLSRGFSRVLVVPVIGNRVARLAKPFFIPPQFFQCRRQEKLRAVLRWMPQRFQQALANQNRNFMRSETQVCRRQFRRHVGRQMPQIQKTFDFLLHNSSAQMCISQLWDCRMFCVNEFASFVSSLETASRHRSEIAAMRRGARSFA